MKNLWNKINNWIFNTKLGHFLFIMIFISLFVIIIQFFMEKPVIIISGLISGGLCSLYFAITDKNKKYW